MADLTDFFSALGQGLRGAGGIISPDVFAMQEKQREQQAAQQQAMQKMALERQMAMETPQAKLAQQHLQDAQAQAVLNKQAQSWLADNASSIDFTDMKSLSKIPPELMDAPVMKSFFSNVKNMENILNLGGPKLSVSDMSKLTQAGIEKLRKGLPRSALDESDFSEKPETRTPFEIGRAHV